MPLPREETTPPVMKTNRAMDRPHTPAAAAVLPVCPRRRSPLWRGRRSQLVGTAGGGGVAGALGAAGGG